ncbi:hypothetical protein QJS66_16125 [Kocuria rhizophila]|nr:hypothetical protein QJS66_16125 [Kocuria rhizophila]
MVVYRELGFGLDAVRDLDDPAVDVVAALREQNMQLGSELTGCSNSHKSAQTMIEAQERGTVNS